MPDGKDLVRRCIRRGVDVAPMRVDVCTQMDFFGWQGARAPGAEKAMTAGPGTGVESLSDEEISERHRAAGQGD